MPSVIILQPDPEAPPGLLIECFVAGGAAVTVQEVREGVTLSAASPCEGLGARRPAAAPEFG